MCRRIILAIVIAALGLADAQAQQFVATDGSSEACAQSDPSTPPQPPQLPPGAEFLRGEVILVISLDHCGRAAAVEVEVSSGDKRLDDAAAAAMRWHFQPQTNPDGRAGGSKVRVPVKFDPDAGGTNPKATSRSKPRDPFFVSRRAMKAKPPALLADGRVPGFVADDYPLGVDSVEEAEAMVIRYGDRQADIDQYIRQYAIFDEEGMSYWYVIQEPSTEGKAIFRQRAVSDGMRGFWVRSSLCEPAGSAMCERFKGYLAALAPQQDMPPPLPPPPKPDTQ